MNIFIFDMDVNKNVQYYPDAYASKMVLETAQILSTALRQNVPEKYLSTLVYKSFNPNHPCCKWVAESSYNYSWLLTLGFRIHSEFYYRYDRKHASFNVIKECSSIFLNNIDLFEDYGLTEFPQCMPEQYRVLDDVVTAYRNYFIGEKLHFAKWTKREVPEWIPKNLLGKA